MTLNDPAQTKQHYEGKSHAKKVKMYMDGEADPEQVSGYESISFLLS